MAPGRRAEALLGLCRAADQVQRVAGMVATEGHGVDVLDELAAARAELDAVTALVTRDYLERSVPIALADHDPFLCDELMRVLGAHR